MSVRKIPRNYRVITGCVASEKSANNAAEFEGSLERDLYHMLDFDWTVEHFEEQPVEIRYKGCPGQNKKIHAGCSDQVRARKSIGSRCWPR